MGWLADKLYNAFMFLLEKRYLHEFRKEIVVLAKGNVLEIGPGTGVNFNYYNTENIESLTVLDTKFTDSVKKKIFEISSVKLVEGDAQSMPFEDKVFDTVIFTLVFCSVDNPYKGLSEIKRVLKDDGRILFIEHVKPKTPKMKKTVDRVNPAWSFLFSGCNINRETMDTIQRAGFTLVPGSYREKGVFISGTAVKG